MFDHIYVLTGGGPGTLTTSVSIHIYKSFFQQEQLARRWRTRCAAGDFAGAAAAGDALHAARGQDMSDGTGPRRCAGWSTGWRCCCSTSGDGDDPDRVQDHSRHQRSPPIWLFPPTLEHFRTVLTDPSVDFLRYIVNSTALALGGALLAMALSLPAAYAVVRFEIGAQTLLPLVTNLRAMPLVVFAIPIYLMYQVTGLLDTRTGLALIACLINLPTSLILFVSWVQDLPLSLEEAARVDGAGTGGVLAPRDPAAGAADAAGRRRAELRLRLERVPVRPDPHHPGGRTGHRRRHLVHHLLGREAGCHGRGHDAVGAAIHAAGSRRLPSSGRALTAGAVKG